MNLETNYLGLKLKNPIVPSAGPLSQEISNFKKFEDAGAAAVVMYSLFEEQIEHEAMELDYQTSVTADSNPEATSYFPEDIEFKLGPEQYLEHIRKAKEAVDIPIIGSLNGKSLGGWTDYAKKIEQAGADALELNIYRLATNQDQSGFDIEKEYLEIVKQVKSSVNIPIAVKLGPYFSSVAWMAKQFEEAGADGLVLFNRFYQPDINLESLEVTPDVLLSTPMDMRLPLRWIGILYGKVKLDFAATSGIDTEQDVLKMIMAGAKVTQMLSSLLRNGIEHITDVLTKMIYWMEVNEYESLDQMRGSISHQNVADPSVFERANYMKVLNSYK
jgi:dihydroorotate dehydrogenase (fumarate)